MNGRLIIIEKKILSLGSAAFQNLCDTYLFLREQELASINRLGSQFGKQKTIKGTPDTFLRLADGSLRLVEYTTKADRLVVKIKADIDKCLDSMKSDDIVNQVFKIIIFFNSRLDVVKETEIFQYAKSKNVKIEMIGLDWLALEIYSKYLILSKDILGIPLDTGQLLPLQNFVEEYNNKAGKLSTPLDNIFLHRETELVEIETHLSNNDLLIISGSPGVGKTKIALEALNRFLSTNKDYSAFAISKKDQDISEDLKIYLQQEKNYILLIDDANRQLPNFKQILGVFRENRTGNIKLLITVREYALNEVEKECLDYEYQTITLKKFTDEEITQLISSDSFEIKNSKYQKRIVEIADGNSRLAIMASRLAKQEQVGFLYGEGERIFELYDFYFKTFIKDFAIFGNKTLLKTLGIISFFFTIDRSNKELLESILKTFGLDYYEFNEAIDELEKRELVEVQYNHARVSEQVMSTYFFYKVFIKDEILSFRSLLFTYFSEWKRRFSDTVIPSNNSFGYDSVLKKISGILDEYLHSVYSDETKVLEFFNLFWFYKREEMLSYFHSKIKNFTEPTNPNYDTKNETNDFVWDRDKTLDFLSNLFNHFTESFVPAVELAFEYCRKKPESLPGLIRRIKEKLLFDDDDHRYNFIRQVELFKLLIAKFNEKQLHYVQAFFELSGTFLAHHFQITKSGRGHSIVFYQYPLPFYEVTKVFRQTIWTTLLGSYEAYPKEVFSIISHFKPGFRDAIPEILEFDLSILIPFIDNKLDPTNFQNIHFVNGFIRWLNKEKLKDKSYQTLKIKFTSKEYEYFRKLDWNALWGKQECEFEKYEEFEKLKEQDIRTSFTFESETDFQALNNAIKNTFSLGENNRFGIIQVLNIIVEENFLKNEELGFKLLASILQNYPVGLDPLYKPIRIIAQKSSDWSFRLWDLIMSWNNDYKLYWQLAFFDCLPIKFTNFFFLNELLTTINSIDRDCYIQFESFEKFIAVKSDSNQNLKRERNIIEEILSIIYEKNKNDNLRIMLSYHFFEKYSVMLAHNFDLLRNSYIQQEKKIDNNFDNNRVGLQALLHINSEFLLEYITIFYTEKEYKWNNNIDNKLSFLWDFENCNELIENAANLIIESSYHFGVLEHPINIFFHHLSGTQKEKAKNFILNFISKYKTNCEKLNAIFDVLMHSMKDLFEEAFLLYLSLNTDIENFKKIWWIGHGGTYNGDVIIGEIRAKEWHYILEIVEKSNNLLYLIPIKAYLKKQIEYELRSAEREKMRKFIDPDDW